jgi:hypothetical protein
MRDGVETPQKVAAVLFYVGVVGCGSMQKSESMVDGGAAFVQILSM